MFVVKQTNQDVNKEVSGDSTRLHNNIKVLVAFLLHSNPAHEDWLTVSMSGTYLGKYIFHFTSVGMPFVWTRGLPHLLRCICGRGCHPFT